MTSKAKPKTKKQITTWPTQCSLCGCKIKKQSAAIKAMQVKSTGELVKWYKGQCVECGQRLSVRTSEKIQKRHTCA